jgi:hypothetical protein
MSPAGDHPAPPRTPPSPPRRHPPRPTCHRVRSAAELPYAQAGLTAAEKEAVVAVTAARLGAVQPARTVGQ